MTLLLKEERILILVFSVRSQSLATTTGNSTKVWQGAKQGECQKVFVANSH